MTKYLNMNIEINESQPLVDVVHELKRLGFDVLPYYNGSCNNIVTKGNGLALFVNYLHIPLFYKPTTLAELKGMK